MQIDHLIAPYIFLGDDRMAEAIYQHMSDGLTVLEQHALLHYLVLPINQDARTAFRSADESARKAALQAVMAKFPRQWPPTDRAA